MADHIYNQGIYVFPEHVENILFKNGFIGNYKVKKTNNKIEVLTESPQTKNTCTVEEQLNLLFSMAVEVTIHPPGALNYPGFGNRFEIRQD